MMLAKTVSSAEKYSSSVREIERQPLPDLLQDCDTVLAANPGPKWHTGENRVNFTEGLQSTQGIFFPGGQKYSRARRMVGMIGVENGNQNRAIEKPCQERLPSKCRERSSRERRIASSTTSTGSGLPVR